MSYIDGRYYEDMKNLYETGYRTSGSDMNFRNRYNEYAKTPITCDKELDMQEMYADFVREQDSFSFFGNRDQRDIKRRENEYEFQREAERVRREMEYENAMREAEEEAAYQSEKFWKEMFSEYGFMNYIGDPTFVREQKPDILEQIGFFNTHVKTELFAKFAKKKYEQYGKDFCDDYKIKTNCARYDFLFDAQARNEYDFYRRAFCKIEMQIDGYEMARKKMIRHLEEIEGTTSNRPMSKDAYNAKIARDTTSYIQSKMEDKEEEKLFENNLSRLGTCGKGLWLTVFLTFNCYLVTLFATFNDPGEVIDFLLIGIVPIIISYIAARIAGKVNEDNKYFAEEYLPNSYKRKSEEELKTLFTFSEVSGNAKKYLAFGEGQSYGIKNLAAVIEDHVSAKFNLFKTSYRDFIYKISLCKAKHTLCQKALLKPLFASGIAATICCIVFYLIIFCLEL